MKLVVRLPIPQASTTVALIHLLTCAPVAAHAQIEGLSPVGQQFIEAGPRFLDGPDSSAGGPYLLGTMALSVPSTMVSAMNLRGERFGGLWLGLAGIGMGVGHGALLMAGMREVETPRGSAVWWNALASAYSTVSGILQIRRTIGAGPDSSLLRASISPNRDGVRLRVTWKR